MLAYTTHKSEGPLTLPSLMIVHGLFGSARNWGVVARRLAVGRDVVAVDMRNHGASPRADTQSYADMAGDLAEVIAPSGRAGGYGRPFDGRQGGDAIGADRGGAAAAAGGG